MNIDSISRGYVLDHIIAGKAMEIYHLLKLDSLDCCIAIIKNVKSAKMGRKDIIKIDDLIALDLEALGFIDSGITVNKVENGEIIQKVHLELPEKLVGVLKCRNPRCITSSEPGLEQAFQLTDRKHKIYRCAYCEEQHK